MKPSRPVKPAKANQRRNKSTSPDRRKASGVLAGQLAFGSDAGKATKAGGKGRRLFGRLTRQDAVDRAAARTTGQPQQPFTDALEVSPDVCDEAFDVPAVGDIVAGDRIRFRENVYEGPAYAPRFAGRRTIWAEVLRDSFGQHLQLHTYTLRVLAVRGRQVSVVVPGQWVRRQADTLHQAQVCRQRWADESHRQLAVQEREARRALVTNSTSRRMDLPKSLRGNAASGHVDQLGFDSLPAWMEAFR